MRGLFIFTLVFLSFSSSVVAKSSTPEVLDAKTLDAEAPFEGPERPSVFALESKEDFTKLFQHATFALDLKTTHFSESDYRLATLEKVFAPKEPALNTDRLMLAQVNKSKALAQAPRVRSLYSETSVFWYSAGASAFTSLATRTLLGIPALVLVISILSDFNRLGPGGFAAIIGTLIVITAIDAALSALAGQVVFNNMSRFYKADFIGGFLGQLAGNGLSTAVFWTAFGFGAMAVWGVADLGALLGLDAINAFNVFTLLGAMPMIVLTFIASLALPAMVGAYALSKTASPRAGYQIDPTWKPMRRTLAPSDRPAIVSRDDAFVTERFSVAIPGT